MLVDNDIQKTDFWIHDCSAATENMLISAHSIGIGAVWLGVHSSEKFIQDTKNLFEIPKNVTPLSIISLGYPYETKPPLENYNPERIRARGANNYSFFIYLRYIGEKLIKIINNFKLF